MSATSHPGVRNVHAFSTRSHIDDLKRPFTTFVLKLNTYIGFLEEIFNKSNFIVFVMLHTYFPVSLQAEVNPPHYDNPLVLELERHHL